MSLHDKLKPLRVLALLSASILYAGTWSLDHARAAYTLDRWFQMGDDILFDADPNNREGAVNGAAVGSGSSLTGPNGAPITYDSAAVNNDTFQPLEAFSSGGGSLATYVEYGVGGNPSAPVAGAASMNSFGIQFDGVDDYLQAVNLNDPSVAAAGSPVTYTTQSRGMQMWVYSTNTDFSQEPIVIDDADEHALVINTSGQWRSELDELRQNSDVAADPNVWTHLMFVRDLDALSGAVTYVNGIAVLSHPGLYDGSNNTDMVVGANAEDDGGLTADPNTLGFPGFFSGIIDEIEVFVTDDGTTYGEFDYTEDNGYFTDVFLPSTSGYGFTLNASTGHNSQTWVEGDINFDGVLDSLDVDAFVAGWLSEAAEFVEFGPPAGDYTTLQLGDLDLDGDTDLGDWVVLRSLNPSITANLSELIAGVPEPSTSVLFVLACFGINARRFHRS